MAEVPHVDVEVRADHYEVDFMAVLAEIRPHWKKEEVVFKLSPKSVNRGLLNTMVRCHRNEDKRDDVIMLRVLNESNVFFLDRVMEVSCIKYLDLKDCAPKLLATFKNGYCYKFIHGEILNSTKLKEEPIWRGVAEELAKIHSANVDEIPNFTKESKFEIFMKKLMDEYPEELKDPAKNERFKKEFPSKESLKADVDEAYAHALSFEPDLVLTHNDTRAENIIWNEETGILRFVDFEGASYNYRASEIANHFQRYGGMEPIDLSLIPDEDFQMKWIRVYLKKYFEETGRKGSDVTEDDVRGLYVQVQKFQLCGFIGLALAAPPLINMDIMPKEFNIDLLAVSLDFLKEYHKQKERIFALEMPKKS